MTDQKTVVAVVEELKQADVIQAYCCCGSKKTTSTSTNVAAAKPAGC